MSEINTVYQYLVNEGVPPGIAIEQARAIAASRQSPFAWGNVNTRARNQLTDAGLLGGLAPGQRALMNSAAYDTNSYDSALSAEIAGLPKEYFGGYRGFGGDVDAQYNAYIQAMTQNIRNEAARNGRFLNQQEAYSLAQQMADPKELFIRQRLSRSGGPADPLKDMGAAIGMDIPIAAATGLAAGEGNFRRDIGRILFGDMPGQGRGPSFARTVVPGLAWGTAAGSALSNNDRGDNWLQSLQRLSRYDRDKGVDAGDYIRLGAGVPSEALANVAAWSTIPAQAITSMRQTPTLANAAGALSRVGPLATMAMGGARLAPDLAIMGLNGRLGTERSNYELAKRHQAIREKFRDDIINREGDGVATRWGDMTNIGRRGLLGRAVTGFDRDASTGERALTLMGDTFQSAGDLLTLPVHALANTGGLVGRAAENLPFVPKGTGAMVRNALTPDQWPRVMAMLRRQSTLDKQIAEGDAKNFESDSERKARRNQERLNSLSTQTHNPNYKPHTPSADLIESAKSNVQSIRDRARISSLENKLKNYSAIGADNATK